MIRFSYQLHDFRHWLTDLSNFLHVPVKGNLLEFPSPLGEGTIHAAQLPMGFSYIIMNFTLKDEFVLFRKESSTRGLCLFFNPAPFLSSTLHEEETVHPKDTPVKRIGLFFPEEFLHHHVRKDILGDLFRYTSSHLVPTIKESAPFEYRSVIEEIFSVDSRSVLSRLVLHNRVLLLAEKFLNAFLTKASFSLPDGKAWLKGKEKDLEALESIIQILSDTQLSRFPSIDSLSKTAMMSSTKLKTRFKQIYGMKLYEFYNRNRLEQAKEMLKTGDFSVKQVGINIGFSNLSNFAKAFKKEFGVLPKEVLRNKQGA
jgi:AraC-like DNA-binding protein